MKTMITSSPRLVLLKALPNCNPKMDRLDTKLTDPTNSIMSTEEVTKSSSLSPLERKSLLSKGALSVNFSSIAIELVELNMPRDEFSSIAIKLTYVTLGRGLKNPVQSSLISVTPGTRIFLKSDYISLYLHTPWSQSGAFFQKATLMEPYLILYEVLLVHICLKLTKSIGMHKICQNLKQDLDQMYARHQKHRQNTGP